MTVVAHKVAFGKPPLVGMHHTRVQSGSQNTNQWGAAHASIGAWELLGSNAIKQLGVQERASSPCHQLGTVPCGRVTDRITRVSCGVSLANGQLGCRVCVWARAKDRVEGNSALFSCFQNFKILQDFSSHRIFERMHKVLNVAKQNN